MAWALCSLEHMAVQDDVLCTCSRITPLWCAEGHRPAWQQISASRKDRGPQGLGSSLNPGPSTSALLLQAEMVIFEAARAICNLKDVTTRELTPAVTLLQLFLSSNKPVVRFAAVRTLNKVRRPAPWRLASYLFD